MTGGDPDFVTDADLKAARDYWDAAGQDPAAPELFARPVYGDGFRGDVTVADAVPGPGTVCTAKRCGWDERLSGGQEDDREPYNLDGRYASDDLDGPLEVHGDGPVKAYLVGGQEADPKTIRAKSS